MMALTIVACPSWSMKASMSSEGPNFSRFYGGESCVIIGIIGYGCALAKVLLRLGSMSFLLYLFLPKFLVGGIKG